MPDIRHAILGNAGTIISFRVGAEDAPHLAREFQPRFDVLDLLNLENHNVYLKPQAHDRWRTERPVQRCYTALLMT